MTHRLLAERKCRAAACLRLEAVRLRLEAVRLRGEAERIWRDAERLRLEPVPLLLWAERKSLLDARGRSSVKQSRDG